MHDGANLSSQEESFGLVLVLFLEDDVLTPLVLTQRGSPYCVSKATPYSQDGGLGAMTA
jgi:hypothetical protein